MPIILLVEKSGSIKEMLLKEVVPEELYRKASFKTAEGFGVQTTWSLPGKYNIKLYARKNGRAGSENKYDFPPPVDNDLFFGGCILTNQDASDMYIDLPKSMWAKIYEDLFGGFEDIGSDDSDDESSEMEDDVPKTKEGYAKDGFIVDDVDVVEEEEEEDAEDEESAEDEDDSEIEGEAEGDLDSVDLCEDDTDDLESDASSESDMDEGEDEDEESEPDDDCYDSDGVVVKEKKKPVKKSTATPHKNTKKPAKPDVVNKQKSPGAIVNTRSRAKKAAVDVGDVNGGGYLNCSNELVEEEYIV